MATTEPYVSTSHNETTLKPVEHDLHVSVVERTSYEDHAAPAGSAPAEAAPPTAHVTYRDLLRNANFRRLWAGQAISTFGSFFTRVAIPVYVFGLTGSYAQLGFAAFSSLVATLLWGLFAGALVDRWDRRRTMIGADIANGVLLLLLLTAITLPLPLATKLGSLYLMNFCAALIRGLFDPARLAIFADVVAEEHLLAANSLDQATTTTGELLSYPLAGLALFALGPAPALGLDALSFFVSALLICRVHVQHASPPEAGSSLWQEIGEGLRFAKNISIVRKITILSLIVPLCMSLLTTLQLPFAVEALGSTKEVGFPALEGAMALGFVLGVLGLGRWGQHVSRVRLLAYGITGFGAAITFQGAVPFVEGLSAMQTVTGPWTLLLLCALPFALLSGAANSLVVTCIRTVLQEQTTREIRGRVGSVISVAAGAGFAMGALLTGLGQGRAAAMLVLLGTMITALGLVTYKWLATAPTEAAVSYN